MFHADLHIHSRFSRACSRDCDIEHLAWWALRKGITVAGTGDFTHPAWAEELKETLIPAEPGLFRLRPEMADRVRRTSPRSCGNQVRFMLSAEISTIYRGGERTRKVHHLLYAPTFEAADRITAALSKIGNLASDGRPILGLDSRHLLEITLDGGPGCYLVPAHVWTPWFAVLGSKSGFDAVADCYADLAAEVFAIETGLSSDPPMNWQCSSLDGYRLVSNSDAHSPPMLGREATTFGTPLDYFAMADALRTGDGLIGTIEFYPEEGKYHLDGHRKCGVRFDPAQTREHGGSCPECGKQLTVGVLHRVAELADRPAGYRPEGAARFTNLVQLPQIIGEILATGPKSKKVGAEVSRLVAALGPELGILSDVPVGDLGQAGGSLLAEAITRLRRGEVRREAGYDGEYGVVRLFGPGELDRSATLFEVTRPGPAASASSGDPATANGLPPAGNGPPANGLAAAGNGSPAATSDLPAATSDLAAAANGLAAAGNDLPAATAPGRGQAAAGAPRPGRPASASRARSGDLDPDQQAAVLADGPLMIIAGPGTGKTRTLAHRMAYQIAERGAAPQSCLAITFTRRAAGEMRERLAALAPRQAAGITVTTFHGLGLMILRDHPGPAGLSSSFGIADDDARLEVAAGLAGSQREGRRLLADAATDPERRQRLVQALLARDLVDLDGLVELPAALLRDRPVLAAALRARWPLISVDEYQDIDAAQFELLRLLAGDGSGLTAIGDPDQAIYGFRGADVGFFLQFAAHYPGATTLHLSARGWGYATLIPVTVQADNGAGLTQGIIGLMNHGQPRSPDDWGVLRAWAWGASRALDYFETDPSVDAKHIALEGHSRYGKATLVAMAYDPRFAIAYVSSSGEGGAKLSRRDWGEIVENLAGTGEYHWMAGNFLKYAGPLHWNDLPVDAHELIALCAPRPVFISGGSTNGDAWVDAKGMFLAAAAAGPVYQLLGKTDLGTTNFPPIATALTNGDLAFRQHTGPHTDAPNWPVFLDFAARYFPVATNPVILPK